MKRRDRKLLERIPGVRLERVGVRLGQGANHRVYAYGTTAVLKVPRRRGGLRSSQAVDLRRDWELLERYFPGFSLQTTVRASHDGRSYAIWQERVSVRQFLRVSAVPPVQQQLRWLIEQNDQLWHDHACSVDFVGGAGVLSFLRALFLPGQEPLLSNLAVTRVKGALRIRLVDCELLRFRPRRGSVLGWVRVAISRATAAVTFLCLRYVLWRASKQEVRALRYVPPPQNRKRHE